MSDTQSMPQGTGSSWKTPLIIITAGCLIAMFGFGLRSSFGLFLGPMTEAREWDLQVISLSFAIQNLLWGLTVPVAGILADKFGAARVIAVGALAYGAGIWGTESATTPLLMHLFFGIVTGVGVGLTAFSLAMAAMAKIVSPEKRSLILGLGTAAGSAGQVIFTPLGNILIMELGWSTALFILSGIAMLIVPLALVLPHTKPGEIKDTSANLTLGTALNEAASHRGYLLLMLGFFVCGFHVAFIGFHFPRYMEDLGLRVSVGATALSLIGLANIAGSFMSGYVGQRWSKKYGLAIIYGLRAVTITGLLLVDKTATVIYIFAIIMGLLWLSTIPLTTGLVAQIFGVRYMATLFGIVFVSHQLGSFAGVYLGGYLHDLYGTYDAVWWAGVVLGLVAMVLHIPINEKPIERTSPAPAE